MAERETKYKVGDVVKVKSWDEMKDEFGLDEWGNIRVKFSFLPGMRFMCGNEYTIRIADHHVDGSDLYVFEHPGNGYSISNDMIVTVNEIEDIADWCGDVSVLF